MSWRPKSRVGRLKERAEAIKPQVENIDLHESQKVLLSLLSKS